MRYLVIKYIIDYNMMIHLIYFLSEKNHDVVDVDDAYLRRSEFWDKQVTSIFVSLWGAYLPWSGNVFSTLFCST